jgi:hypothetical protein
LRPGNSKPFASLLRDAWYFASRRIDAGAERWLVGNPSLDETREYGDRAAACAAFVSRLLGRPYVLPGES